MVLLLNEQPTAETSVSEPEISSFDSESSSEAQFDTPSETFEISSADTVNGEPDKEENDLKIEITVNGRTFSATLYDNETAAAFKERLPLTLDMSELNGNEKYYYLPDSLPRNSSRPSGINTGDIMLYGLSVACRPFFGYTVLIYQHAALCRSGCIQR